MGGPASGVTWAGGPAPGDIELPIRLGPLPNEPGRLQFKTVQTYDNGAVARWIDDWPEGGPEPPAPGPVLDLVPGGPGSIPATTVSSTNIYESEITKGLNVFRLNDATFAGAVSVDHLNPQTQEFSLD